MPSATEGSEVEPGFTVPSNLSQRIGLAEAHDSHVVLEAETCASRITHLTPTRKRLLGPVINVLRL